MRLVVPDLWMYDEADLKGRFEPDLAMYLTREEKYELIYDIKRAAILRMEPDLDNLHTIATLRQRSANQKDHCDGCNCSGS